MQKKINGFDHCKKEYVKIEKLKDDIHKFKYDFEKKNSGSEDLEIEEQNGIF